MHRRLSWLLAAWLAAAVLTGCSRVEQIREDTIEITTEEGDEFTQHTGGELPEGFPLPLMPGARLLSSTEVTSAEGKRGYLVMLAYEGDVGQVEAFYEQALKDAGFQVERIQTGGEGEPTAFLTGTSPTHYAAIAIQTVADGPQPGVSVVLEVGEE